MASTPPVLNTIAVSKLRCDREKPACKRCCRLSADCVYDPPRYGERRIDLKGYRFRADPTLIAGDGEISIPKETAVSWVQRFYDKQSTMGLLLPINKDFMLTIPSILDNPYVQVDIRVVILYYGTLNDGMLLSPGLSASEKKKYSLYFYRKNLQHLEYWQCQGQVNELNLHVAFWMAHEAYCQLDLDLSHRLHGYACQIARDLGLLQLDAETQIPFSSFNQISSWPPENLRPADNIDTVYRDVHRIYFWHILIRDDYLFQYHLYRSGNIDPGTWNVYLPDSSTRKSLSNINLDTEVYFEVSLHLVLIEHKYSEFEKSRVWRTSAGGPLNEAGQVKLRDMLLEVIAVLSEWQVEQLLSQVSSRVNACLYAHVIWRATSMIISFLRIQERNAVWPTEHNKKLEHEAACRSIKALQCLFDFDRGGLLWNLGHFKCFFAPCLGILFINILTTPSEQIAASDLALTLQVQTIVTWCANERRELRSLEMFLQTLNRYSQLVLQQRFPSVRPQAQTHRDWQRTLPQLILPADTGEPTSGQARNSNRRLPEGITACSYSEAEFEFLHARGIDVGELYNEPYRMVLVLEKDLLTEPDPHRHWWGFEP
ncbi:hypothetical protein BDV39DRAFT_215417 [Aspergillus sergii]|uniref:Zn(2)-C6 fungal-type domain-containing protein n=1 Tax=Aspergillus sergii TaxID=1034303 RepID=A0A5N6X1F1_9EURO|nr:hypothetical protein BDV39DRAFT_215417 [Aspergillus sergii]